MTVKLELQPDIEANLAAQASARGLSLDTYLQNVVEDLAKGNGAPPMNLLTFRATLDLLAEMGRNLPQLPASAFSRENMYQDRG